jgi:hypothetical protein
MSAKNLTQALIVAQKQSILQFNQVMKKSQPLWRAMLEASDKECNAMTGIPADADQRIMAAHINAMADIEVLGWKLPKFWRDAFHHEANRARRGE